MEKSNYKMAHPLLFWCGGVGVILFSIIGNLGMPDPKYVGAFVAGIIMAFIGGRNKNKKLETVHAYHDEETSISEKVNIVNARDYLDAKDIERVAYLQKLYKQTVADLKRSQTKLESEIKKIDNMPKDVSKYIDGKHISELQKEVYKYEDKLLAIQELLDSEKSNIKTPTKKINATHDPNAEQVSIGQAKTTNSNNDWYDDDDD